MHDLKEFAASSNGDRWFLGTDEATQNLRVLHRGNEASGGHETQMEVDQFLNNKPFGPERELLRALLGVGDDPAHSAKE